MECSRGKCENTVVQSSEVASPVSGLLRLYATPVPIGPGVSVAPNPDGSSRSPIESSVSTAIKEEERAGS